MPKNTKQASKKDLKKEESVIIGEDSQVEEAAPAAELDPEILAALESKRKKKTLNPSDVDYIPELERDVDFSDTF